MKYINYLFLLLFLAGCQSGSDKSAPEMTDMEFNEAPLTKRESSLQAPPPPQASSEMNIPVEEIEKKIIKDGDIGLLVSNLEQAKSTTDSLLSRFNAYYASENLSNNQDALIYYLTIRIPAKHFEKFISLLEAGKEEIMFKNISSRDVTEQFIDLETRLENKQAYLKRYRELLQKATKVSEILEIEEKIRVIEEEIESVQGRLKYLNNQVDYSTLNLTLRKEKEFTYKPPVRDNFFARVKSSFSKGWYVFVDFSLFLMKLWPFIILIIVLIPLFKRWKKRKETGHKN